MPNEENITDCIRCRDPKQHNTNVKKALENAIEQQMVVKWNVGVLQLFVGKNDKVWRCVSPIGGNPKKYSKETWNEIKKSLTTPFGRLAIMGTQCKYEAVLPKGEMKLAFGQYMKLETYKTPKSLLVAEVTNSQP
ncbi:hypothetical protein JHK82_055938 [Glycine max]|nr:hypothetical protein JHK86_055760 [Glycine max]KAG4918493.1 hypothetical protein JHK85_056774 [Glycine max]KAG5074572.1 hypothetical protein JHK84_055803 [Glycine max]KAG5077243.1 hypothetical protein JHK82_055938 [Glycine max]